MNYKTILVRTLIPKISTNRNIHEGTEVEFLWMDDLIEEEKIITGVVLEVDYTNSTFKVDSYENI
jgi:hypothetical protein